MVFFIKKYLHFCEKYRLYLLAIHDRLTQIKGIDHPPKKLCCFARTEAEPCMSRISTRKKLAKENVDKSEGET